MIIGIRIWTGKEMIYPLQFLVKQTVLNTNTVVKTIDADPANEIETDKYMLFTGRHAANGSIYVSDILKITAISGEIYGIVMKDDKLMQFYVLTENGKIQLPYDESAIEIVGNEYQDPNLYKEIMKEVKGNLGDTKSAIGYGDEARKTSDKNYAANESNEFVLYTDGSCLKNPGGAGGWAYIITKNNTVVRERCGAEESTTNQRMELTAAIEGLKSFGDKRARIKVISDSQYLTLGFTDGRVEKWKANGYLTTGCQQVKNVELWMELDRLNSRHTIEWVWERGHSGSPFNERCDELAKKAAFQQQKKRSA